MRLRLLGMLAVTVIFGGTARAQDPTTPPPAGETPPAPPPAAGGGGMMAGGGARGFGAVGQMVVSSDIEFAIVHSSQGNNSSTNILIQPALDYFIAPNISVGGMVGFGKGSFSSSTGGITIDSGDTTTIGFAVRGGYNLAINDMLSFWARISLGYNHTSFSVAGMDVSGYNVPLDIFAPLLWHPADHFFIGLGPVLSVELANSVEGNSQDKTTSFGVQSTVGGYWGGK
jgi:hypothetical protein